MASIFLVTDVNPSLETLNNVDAHFSWYCPDTTIDIIFKLGDRSRLIGVDVIFAVFPEEKV